MTLPRSSYTIQKSKRGTVWKLKNNSFLIGYNFRQNSDVRIWMVENTPDGSRELRLVEGTHYILEPTGAVTLIEEALGLTQSSPLEIQFHTNRLTEVQDIRFSPGHPVKADDLNDLFDMLILRTEELDGLVTSNAWVSDTPPPNPWVGMLWVSSNDYRIHTFTNQNIWVDVK